MLIPDDYAPSARRSIAAVAMLAALIRRNGALAPLTPAAASDAAASRQRLPRHACLRTPGFQPLSRAHATAYRHYPLISSAIV